MGSLLRRLVDDIGPGSFVVHADGPDRPDLLVLDERYGLIAIDIEPHGDDPRSREPVVRLSRKIAELRQSVSLPGRLRPQRLVLFGGYGNELISTGHLALSPADLGGRGWMKWLPESPISADDLAGLRAELVPALAFDRRLRRGAHDPGLGERQRLRTVLDVEQSMAATGPVKDVLMISGPPGSGKTLVLAGRARLLATQHPDWRIALLCFNNALVPYLRQLVADHPQIGVNTFGKFAHGLGHRLSLDSEAEAERDFGRAKAKGIVASVDAVLIDEVQDFYPGWLRFALATLRDGRGGAVLAGDAEQALYRDAVSYSFLADRQVERLTLTRAYRGTRQIMDAALAAVSRPQQGTGDEIPDGEQVELIWADSWNSQAEVVAWEARRLLDSGERDPADIGILVTQRQGILNPLKSVLAAAGVPYLIIDRDNAATFDPGSPTVKVMTVHAAKGHEFGVVILFGLEALPRPEDDDKARRGRVGFVGMTRARDQLMLTYTRDNVYLDRLRRCPQVRMWTWPDDYEV